MFLKRKPDVSEEQGSNDELEMEAIAKFESELEAEAKIEEAEAEMEAVVLTSPSEPEVIEIPAPVPQYVPEPATTPQPLTPSLETLIAEAVAKALSLTAEPDAVIEIPEEPKVSKRYIIKETQVDKFNIVRTRIELTPAVCDKCGFDVAARNNLGQYDKMTPEMQEQVRGAIQEHKDIVHTIATDLIVDEDELPTEWLGQHKKF